MAQRRHAAPRFVRRIRKTPTFRAGLPFTLAVLSTAAARGANTCKIWLCSSFLENWAVCRSKNAADLHQGPECRRRIIEVALLVPRPHGERQVQESFRVENRSSSLPNRRKGRNIRSAPVHCRRGICVKVATSSTSRVPRLCSIVHFRSPSRGFGDIGHWFGPPVSLSQTAGGFDAKSSRFSP